MKTDVQIAQEAKMLPVTEVAAKLGLKEDDLEHYGKYKAKVNLEVLDRLKDKPDGKLVLVTAITPTPAGEGKTTVNIGLSMALNKIGKNAITTLREPSLGQALVLKVELQVEDMLKFYRWKTLIYISQEIFMQ